MMLNGMGIFFILAIVSYFLGVAGVAGLTLVMGKVLFVTFLVLAGISFSETLARAPNSYNQS